MLPTFVFTRRLLRWVLLPIAVSLPLNAQAAETPTRAKDLRYGEALYHYHQGDLFTALTNLEVAKAKGGISGHGDHPLLVEGGLLLTYGLHREAKARFEQALKDQIDASRRNKAWFYLGKVLYLEGDDESASEALAKVQDGLLFEDDRALFWEWHYLKNQIDLRAGRDTAGNVTLEQTDDLWWAYLEYNKALRSEQTLMVLRQLDKQLKRFIDEMNDFANLIEALALRDRVLLSIGQLELQNGNYLGAHAALKQMRRDGVFAEEGLFQFAVAASHIDQPEQALAALKQLQGRDLFTPWLQQVSYALGYLYEQMGEPSLAYEAYRAASGHYRTHMLQLGLKKDSLNEQKLLAALQFSAGDKAGLGSQLLETDVYGRLQVSPEQYEYAALLADERFQLALRDLHELYKLRDSLDTWARQLDSFDSMLDTRRRQREQKILATQQELERLQVEQWEAKRAAYEQAINQAVQAEDWAFFMNEDQMEMVETLEAVKANLALIPDNEDYADLKQEFAEKLRRAQGYFDWWLADSFGVNRWAAQKQLNALNSAMREFEQRNASLQALIADDKALQALDDRVTQGRTRLAMLREQLALALVGAREQLMALVRAELERQQAETADYLLASREAQARLADQLLMVQTPQSSEPPEATDQAESAQTEAAVQTEEEGAP